MMDPTITHLFTGLQGHVGWEANTATVPDHNTNSRLLGIHAATTYCTRHGLDPDDSALDKWHAGNISEGILLRWKSEGPTRDTAREIAVIVAKTAFQVILRTNAEKREETPLFYAFSQLTGELVTGMLDIADYEIKTTALLMNHTSLAVGDNSTS